MSAEKPETMDAALDRGPGSAAMTPTSSEASWLAQSRTATRISIYRFRKYFRCMELFSLRIIFQIF